MPSGGRKTDIGRIFAPIWIGSAFSPSTSVCSRALFSFAGLLHSLAAFGIGLALRRAIAVFLGCGCSSGVEHNLAKVGVEGSNPFARSRNHLSDMSKAYVTA